VWPDELKRLTVPTLLAWGQHEPLGDLAVARAAASLMPHGQLEVLPGGHAPWLGHPTETATAISNFVDRDKART
jgi:pimeloyl-ACP methyl ester carboxylesterase